MVELRLIIYRDVFRVYKSVIYYFVMYICMKLAVFLQFFFSSIRLVYSTFGINSNLYVFPVHFILLVLIKIRNVSLQCNDILILFRLENKAST